MALRFNEQGRYLRSFVAADSCFIDIMMNVGIIFEAARATGDEDLLRIATEHCLTTRRHLVRGDGSTAHEAIFDLETGEFLRNGTHQGWRPDSSWARGQAWALYGFGTAYALSGDARFLDTAERCADFFLDRTGDRRRAAQRLGGARSATALRVLGGRHRRQRPVAAGRPHRRPGSEPTRYRDATIAILTRLASPDFLAVDDPAWEGILRHGVYHERRELGVDESVMWGDYFFVEALDRVARDRLRTPILGGRPVSDRHTHIVIGAGAAGCAVAARLSEDAGQSRPPARSGRPRLEPAHPHAGRASRS